MSKLYSEFFEEGWYNQLSDFINGLEFQVLGTSIAMERNKHKVYPEDMDTIFRTFRETPFDKVRVVIIGQDPYHDGSADGLAFSNGKLKPGQKISTSLKYILKEAVRQMTGTKVGAPIPSEALIKYCMDRKEITEDNFYDLSYWSKQGVLLLNASLTVRQGVPLSHMHLWIPFTSYVINLLSNKKDRLIFMLWGKFAQRLETQIDQSKHTILTCGHPVTVVYGNDTWTGNDHFIQANHLLCKWNGIYSDILW